MARSFRFWGLVLLVLTPIVVFLVLVNGVRLGGTRYQIKFTTDGGATLQTWRPGMIDLYDPEWTNDAPADVIVRPEGIDKVPRPRTEYGADGKPIPAPEDVQQLIIP